MGEPTVTPEMVRAALESCAVDDEGPYLSLCEHLDYSGENKARTVARAALAAALAVAPPPHPLVALLTEALAVTDPERPPESVVLMDGDVLLEWVKPTAEVVWDGHAFAGHSRQARLTTTDPAEARAWLATALAVSRG